MHTRSVLAGLVISQVAIAACTGTPATPAFHPTFEVTTCPDDVTSVVLTPATCGFLAVLEDRSDSDGRTIRLFVVRVEPAGGHPADDPVFVADDFGEHPGYADNAGLAQRVNREVVLLDQRGTGHSEPNLECPEVSARAEELVGSPLSHPATNIHEVIVEQDLRTAVRRCRDRLTEDGVDLSQYNLEENAADAEDLRQTLGIERWNLTSHGTDSRILLEVVRRFPQHVRAVILDTPSFPQMSDPVAAIQGTKIALAQLFADCATQPTCDTQFPDLPNAMREAVARLDRSPIAVSVKDSGAARSAGHPIGVVVDGGAFLRVIRAMVSDIDLGLASKVPATVYAVLDGNVDAVATLLSDDSLCIGYEAKCGVQHPFVEGAYYSIYCHDEAPSTGSSELSQISDGDPGYLEAYVTGPYLSDICPVWQAGHAGPEADDPVSSDIPTLIFVGAYDSYASPSVVREAAGTLSASFIVSAPFVGHNAMSTSECYITIRNAWLESPNSAPDTSCVANIPPLSFVSG